MGAVREGRVAGWRASRNRLRAWADRRIAGSQGNRRDTLRHRHNVDPERRPDGNAEANTPRAASLRPATAALCAVRRTLGSREAPAGLDRGLPGRAPAGLEARL